MYNRVVQTRTSEMSSKKENGFFVWFMKINILTGSEFRFEEKAPPERVDSAAKESDAIAPALSWIGFWYLSV